MLAWSSVAHAGYLLMALRAGSGPAFGAILFYFWVYLLMTLGGFPAPNPVNMSTQAALAGLGRMVVLIVALYVLTSVLTGLSFFGMTWAGSHALRQMREELFQHLHRLSLGYYAEHEAGDLMSRITIDTETIQQAFSFALINVLSGALLVVWIGYNMLKASVPFALLSLVTVPLMIAATVWLSPQARKAYPGRRKRPRKLKPPRTATLNCRYRRQHRTRNSETSCAARAVKFGWFLVGVLRMSMRTWSNDTLVSAHWRPAPGRSFGSFRATLTLRSEA